jgi:hypothetical protein
MKKENQSIMEELAQTIAQWETTQQGQTSGYEYEKSFVEMWQKLGNKILQNSVGKLPASRNEKKTSNKSGKNKDSQKSSVG